MRLLASSCLVLASLSAHASAGFVSSAVIDDFGSSSGLGFDRSIGGAASINNNELFLNGSASVTYLAGSSFDASAFNGFSLRITNGSLGTGGLFISVIGESFNFVAMDVDFGSTIVDGYAWITFDQLDAAVGSDPGTIQSALSSGLGFAGIGLYTTGNASLVVDDFEFRTSAVPAPGAIALAAAAGLAASRRRR